MCEELGKPCNSYSAASAIILEPLFIGSHLAADFLNTAFEPDGALRDDR